MALETGTQIPKAEGKQANQGSQNAPPNLPIGTVPAAFKLVEDAVIFVERTKFASKIFVNLFGTFKLTLDIKKKQKRDKKGYLRKLDRHT